jgi:hypothetical protein
VTIALLLATVLIMQVGQFIESVKQELEDDLGTAPYGGSVVKGLFVWAFCSFPLK